ncbi:putative intergrin alpha chain protein [Trypanosoma vivax]|uniref:Putative intergrin alpha chain protein n=1 Tax=Trypanosoma vivax (strain Y486) TaxID=1055687 RepID=G0TWM1_TRYVY|nr:putative intergrin alpha chain protein [Trypanosoma vivax]CCC48359.1 putative intergrin alpha chain protein [Trypanosoma vivax Y486]
MPPKTDNFVMRPVFQLQLNAKLMEGLATIGRFDGSTPSLVCATSTQQVLVHTSGDQEVMQSRKASLSSSPIRTLSFGKNPTAITAGRISNGPDGVDALYFGASTSLTAYNVQKNTEYFYKKVEDGVHAVVCGSVKGPRDVAGGADRGKNQNAEDPPWVIVGGNCVINGFDGNGDEVLSTVTGGQVTALMLMPWAKAKGKSAAAARGKVKSLVAASENFELRVFDGEEAITSIMTAERVHQLLYSGTPGRFAYLSDNGTIGVYNKNERVWRAKGKHRPVSAAFCDVDFDGVQELVVGWSNGLVEVRDGAEKRGVMFKETFSAPVSSVLADDYRQNGQPLPIICTVDGVVRGIQQTRAEEGVVVTRKKETVRLDTLLEERQALTVELECIEEQLARWQLGETDATLPQAGTSVQYHMRPNAESGKLDLVFKLEQAQEDTIVHGCVLQSEALFPGKEDAFFTQDEPSSSLTCALTVPRGVDILVSASVIVGSMNAVNYQIHELGFTIPSCCMFQLWEGGKSEREFPDPVGGVTLELPESFDFSQLENWLKKTFELSGGASVGTSSDFSLSFVDMQDRSGLVISGRPSNHELSIRANSMDTCCVIVESLAKSTVTEASARCDFPEELRELQDSIDRVEEFDLVRQKLSNDMAEVATSVKPLLIHAEDSRLMSDITSMRRYYAQLYDLDKELIAENMKRCNNYNELKAALKQVNAFIMKAGKLRIGQAKTNLIADCRDCVRTGDMRPLINLTRTGKR